MNANRRGFSVVEVLMSSGVLSIGVIASVRMYTSVAQGTVMTRHQYEATSFAEQRLESLSAQGLGNIPACVGTPGCRISREQYATPLSQAGNYHCTQYIDRAALLDGSTTESFGTYRVDTVVTDHPDQTRFDGAQLMTLSICWEDRAGSIQELQVQRLLVPDDV